MPASPNHLPDLSLAGPYLRAIADCISTSGANARELLSRNGIEPAAIDDAAIELPLTNFARLLRDAITTTGEPALGLLVGDRLGVTSHGALGAAILRGTTLREIARLLVDQLDARAPLVGLDVVQIGNEFRLLVRDALPRGQVRRALLEAVVVALATLIEQIAQGTSAIIRIAFDDRTPPYSNFARALLRRPVRWGESFTGLVLPACQVDLPLHGGDPIAFASLIRRAEQELVSQAGDRPVSTALHRLLLGRRGACQRCLQQPACSNFSHDHCTGGWSTKARPFGLSSKRSVRHSHGSISPSRTGPYRRSRWRSVMRTRQISGAH
ncbi:MAG: AraC family transcriptional regulator ligand-binding domain-containing protein [Lysobacteraceae bacterium]